ncbi:MAG: hypothetical protein ABIG68_03535, partial [Acidobacteriota bacterium]
MQDGESRSLAVGYAFDRELQKAANAAGRNYWYAYIEEILSRLGVDARSMPLAACADTEALSQTGVLFLGDFSESDLPPAAPSALTCWVASGGILIGFATQALDDLFGVYAGGTIPQEPDPFSISGYFELLPSPVTQDCRAPVDPWQRLIIAAPVRQLGCTTSQPLARLFRCHPEHPGDGTRAVATGHPAIVHRPLGAGHAFYFAFDLAQTIWVVQQGRPVDQDYDGDGYLRRTDASVVGDNSRAVPYTDAL